MYDTSPAASWTDGFLTGNGTCGAILHGAATREKVVFDHHRLVLPNGTRTVQPPVISGRLEGVRDKALAADPPASTATSPPGGHCAGGRATTPRTNCTSTPQA
ncbi:glycoside hydrolase N-terminal domain-containing protein [Streptomyces canus]|uniref:glycoside hydrolase N-terminal domain-containing protein n=1 Tax=Streptomyces canus TaxID=58343 RepID=UPI003248410D